MVDTPHHDFHLPAELLNLENPLDANGDITSPEMERNFWNVTPDERRLLPTAVWDVLFSSSESSSDSSDDEAVDGLSDVETTTFYPDIASSAQIEFAPPTDGHTVTLPPRNGPPNLHSSTEAKDSTQNALESMANRGPVTHESSSSRNIEAEKKERNARIQKSMEHKAQFNRGYVPSPLSQPPMMADADDLELVRTKTGAKSTRLESPHDSLVEPEQRQKRPESAENEEDNTSIDSIVGNAISHAVPFQGQLPPPSAHSYGKCASKFVKGLFGRGKNERKSTEDEPPPSPPGDGEVPGERKRTSDASSQTRKRRSSSDSSQSPKRSRTSSNSVKVSGRRLPLLFTLATSSSGVEHRHLVIPLPVSWPTFRRMAVEAFAREPCGQEIPTEVSDQAKYVMKWNKPVNLAHGGNFPEKTELCRENINAVLQWMLYSGSYDFCEIHDTPTAECIVKDEASSVVPENKPHERESGGNMAVNGTTALGSKGDHETACRVPNSGREAKAQSQEDIQPTGKAATGKRGAELIRKPEQNVKDNADAEERESIGIEGIFMTETGVNIERKGG